jgi:hypothetical protein
METPEFIKRIDWTDLRTQKSALIEVMNTVTTVEQGQALEGILALIDAIQDYAVDEMDVPEIHVFDFELEEERENPDPDKTKCVYLCMHCGGDHVQVKSWTKPNDGQKFVDEVEGDELGWCDDCQLSSVIQTAELKTCAKVIGFQVVGEDGTEQDGEIHPDMDASFCVYNLSQANEMLNSDIEGQWRLLTLWEGDVEEPTMMFEGDPRA